MAQDKIIQNHYYQLAQNEIQNIVVNSKEWSDAFRNKISAYYETLTIENSKELYDTIMKDKSQYLTTIHQDVMKNSLKYGGFILALGVTSYTASWFVNKYIRKIYSISNIVTTLTRGFGIGATLVGFGIIVTAGH